MTPRTAFVDHKTSQFYPQLAPPAWNCYPSRMTEPARLELVDRSRIRPITEAEWISLPEDDAGELVDGWLVEEEVPDAIHEVLIAALVQLFRNWIAPRGVVMGSEAKFSLLGRGRKPDVSVFLPGQPFPPRRGVIRVPPHLVVEIVSPTPRDGRRDRVEKFDEYAAFGVPYYWLVDPELRSVEIFERDPAGRYARLIGRSSGSIEEVPGCPGLSLDIDQLWAAADQLPAED